ncbi:MAG: IS110 family transposase [Acidobacteriota bacterium]|nr:IS110 family transposase [Acidobacteriota bacterium]
MLIIGNDFHSRYQVIAMLDRESGEVERRRLEHTNGEVRTFYASLPKPALVGIESTSYTLWFAELMNELGHELVTGDAAKIRASETRKQKYDGRDAMHMMELLAEGKFPRIWLPGAEDRDVRVLLHHRHFLVAMRTRAKNGLQALAMNRNLCLGAKLWTVAGQQAFQALDLREAPARRRQDLLQLRGQLDGWIQELDERLKEEVEKRPEAKRLQTHPGVGPLTALATVVVLGPVERFPHGRKVASYLGLIPSEHSSGGRQHFGHLTKQGNRLLRFLLIEAATSACRCDPELKQDYKRLAFRHGWAKARVAVGRKLAIRLYIMLRDQIDYTEFVRRGSHAGMPGKVALV